jgi:hypothetical protein
MMDSMRWSQPSPGPTEGEEPPTIKNHSVTHFNGYLFCFGGYDGELKNALQRVELILLHVD